MRFINLQIIKYELSIIFLTQLGIIESELKLKLELRDIKEQFRDLLLAYLELQSPCVPSDLDDLPRSKTPESEDNLLIDDLPLLDDSGLHDSSTIVYSTDAYSSTVDDTPTNRRMPRDRYLMLNEDGSRASSDSFDSSGQWPKRAGFRRPLMSEPQLISRRISMRLAYPISIGDRAKETDDESGCFSREPTYPGSESLGMEHLKSSTDVSPDYSMEANKDSEVNLNDLTSPEGISDMTDSSLHGMSTTYDRDESSYKESDAAWSPESMIAPPTVIKVKRPNDKTFEPIRRNRNRKILMERLNRQTSIATCSSTNSDSKLPYAPMNSPNSTAITTEFDITNSTSFLPNTTAWSTISATSINQEQFDLHLLQLAMVKKDTPSSTILSVGTADSSSLLSLAKSVDSAASKDSQSYSESQGSVESIASSVRPPCIGGEASTLNVTPDNDVPELIPETVRPKTTKISKTPLGKTLSMMKRTNSFSFKRFSRSSKTNSNLGSSASSHTSSESVSLSREDNSTTETNSSNPSSTDTKSLADSDVIDIDPYIEKAEKANRMSKRFPLLKRFQSIKRHFRTGSKGKVYIQKDSESN